MGELSFLNREELERRVLTKKGKVNLDATLKDFVEYVGYRKGRNEEGLSFSAYLQLRKFDDITIRDLGKIRAYGLKRLMIAGIGEKKTKDLNEVLSKYGVKPIPWITKRYRAWELKKELNKKYGKDICIVSDILVKEG